MPQELTAPIARSSRSCFPLLVRFLQALRAPTILVISLLLLMSDAAAADSTAELDPKSLVVPASALGPEWSGSQLSANMSIVDETNGFYG